MNIIVLEIGRPIKGSVERQFGKADKVISYPMVKPEDYPKIARDFYKAVSPNEENILILSGPIVLNFLLGQLVGLNHFNIRLFQWDAERGRYVEVPKAERSWLF